VVQTAGKLLVIAGIIIAAAGLNLIFGNPLHLGKLPGDIIIKKDGFPFYLPAGTCLLISVIASLIFFFLGKK
jgi:hypothetical protein